MPRSPAPDAVVVGGGAIGLAVAWRLARSGALVTVADPTPGRGASWAAAGMLAPVSEATYGEEPLLRLSMASLALWREFAAELEAASGREVGLRTDGTLVVGVDAGDRAVLADLHRFHTELGAPSTRLSGADSRELEPLLGPQVRSALLVEDEASVDNRLLVAALQAALLAAGGRVVERRAVEVLSHDGAVTGVVLDGGERLATATVVLAAGAGSAAVHGLPPGLEVPVRPVRGEILRLAQETGVVALRRTVRGLVAGSSVYLVPRAHGELVVGATVAERGWDDRVTAGGVHALLRDARALVPGIDELELLEARAGLRPGSPDNLPMLGPAGVDGLVVATGHYRNGILLTPVTAAVVGDLVAGRPPSLDERLLAAVDPRRFAAVVAR